MLRLRRRAALKCFQVRWNHLTTRKTRKTKETRLVPGSIQPGTSLGPDLRLAVELRAPLAPRAMPIAGDVVAAGEVPTLRVARDVDLVGDDEIVRIDAARDELADLEAHEVERPDVLDFLGDVAD